MSNPKVVTFGTHGAKVLDRIQAEEARKAEAFRTVPALIIAKRLDDAGMLDIDTDVEAAGRLINECLGELLKDA